MPYELLNAYLNLPLLLLVVSRLAGMVMFQPLLGSLSIPPQVRVLLVLGLAAMVMPLVALPESAPATPLELALALGVELMLGALLGLAVRACFLALELGGQIIAQESGLAFAEIVDPTSGGQQDVLSMVYVQLGAVVFMIVGGHRAVLAACLDSFAAIPLLSGPDLIERGVWLVLDALRVGGEVALRVAAPVLLTLFLVNVVLGFIGRVLPQLNVTVLGFSLKGLVVFVVAAVALPASMEAFVGGLEMVMELARSVLN